MDDKQYREPRHDLKGRFNDKYDSGGRMDCGEGDLDAHDVFIRQMGGEVRPLGGHQKAATKRAEQVKIPGEDTRVHEMGPEAIDMPVKPGVMNMGSMTQEY